MRGGKRAGAGRPRSAAPKKAIGGIRLPQDLYEVYEKQPKKNEFIENAVRAYTESQKSDEARENGENKPQD